jgi:hypothetical protein
MARTLNVMFIIALITVVTYVTSAPIQDLEGCLFLQLSSEPPFWYLFCTGVKLEYVRNPLTDWDTPLPVSAITELQPGKDL